MLEIKPCPFCGEVPIIEYACGEWFVFVTKKNFQCLCGSFNEMHSSKSLEIEAWNRRAENARDII